MTTDATLRFITVTGRLLAVAVGLVLFSTFVPGNNQLPPMTVFFYFPATFLIFVPALLLFEESRPGRRGRPVRNRRTPFDLGAGKRQFADLYQHLSREARIAYTILFVVLLLVAMSSHATSEGSPEKTASGYEIVNHGARTPTDESGYQAAVANQTRIFASISIMLVLNATLMAEASIRYRSRSDTAGHPGDASPSAHMLAAPPD